MLPLLENRVGKGAISEELLAPRGKVRPFIRLWPEPFRNYAGNNLVALARLDRLPIIHPLFELSRVPEADEQ